MYVYVEGNIGAGKSTLLDRLAARPTTSGSAREIVAIKEPVEDWGAPLPGAGGAGILQLYYGDKRAHAVAFQAHVLISRLTQLLRAGQEHPGAIIVSERSPASGAIFVRQMVDAGILTEAEGALHTSWIAAAEAALKPAGVVYLSVSPAKCIERIRHRGRSGEDAIDASLLADLHARHDEFVQERAESLPTMRIDGSSEHASDMDANVDNVVNFVRLLRAERSVQA